MPSYKDNIYGSSDQRELELREIDTYDSMNPELFYDYVDRLEHAKSFLDTHVKGDTEGDVKRSLLAYSGLAGGMTNFWANPYDFMGMDQHQANQLRLQPDVMGGKDWATVSPQNPYLVNINTKNIDRDQYPSSRLLAHELGHTKVGVEEINRRKGLAPTKWEPEFTPSFKRDYVAQSQASGPYWHGSGIGSNEDESMAYLRGREGELRQGKTLRDDPATRSLFANHPGLYEEYVRSSKTIKSLRGKR